MLRATVERTGIGGVRGKRKARGSKAAPRAGVARMGLGLLAEFVGAGCQGERGDDWSGCADQLYDGVADVVGNPNVAGRIDGDVERIIEQGSEGVDRRRVLGFRDVVSWG